MATAKRIPGETGPLLADNHTIFPSQLRKVLKTLNIHAELGAVQHALLRISHRTKLPDKVELTLSTEEAQLLFDLSYRCSGCPNRTRRGIMSAIGDALSDEAGIVADDNSGSRDDLPLDIRFKRKGD